MSITTKTGDTGETGLWSGQRISKDDLRVECYGTLDELNSFLGEAKHYVKSAEVHKIIEQVQKDLFKVAGELATKDIPFVDPVSEMETDEMTAQIHNFESKVELTGFVLPGSIISSAKLDICRTIARKAERRIITLSRHEKIPATIIKYVNRLSDLIYIMARFEEKMEGKIRLKNLE
jgi:ATP:cob(I)alamin adenosyltransferase